MLAAISARLIVTGKSDAPSYPALEPRLPVEPAPPRALAFSQDKRFAGEMALDSFRVRWIARHVLPHEAALRAQIKQWSLPVDLDADDIVQEIYAKFTLMDEVEKIRHPRSYMMTAARNVLLMHLRRAQVVSIVAIESLENFDPADDSPGPEARATDRQQLQRLADKVATFPEPARSAFTLRMIDGLPHRAIGERLGLSENAVQKNIAKSLKLLADWLGRGGNDRSRASNDRGEEMTDRIYDPARDQRDD